MKNLIKDKAHKRRRELYALNRHKMIEKTKKWQKKNPEKVKEARKKWTAKNPDYMKEFKREYPEKYKAYRFNTSMWKLGIKMSYEEFKQMLKKQKGLCAICNKEETKRRISVDHNHKTGKVRGLLCQECNIALGLLKDNPKLLKKAINYLKN